jgi:hypothetical protein
MLKAELDYKAVVEQCGGAEYVGRRGDTVLFRDRERDAVLSLYVEAVTPQNIVLALKAAHERHNAIHGWEKVCVSERG